MSNHPNKCPAHNTTTTTGGGSRAPHFPVMKKAKSQAVSCSTDTKNRIHHHPQQGVHFEDEYGDNLMVVDEDLKHGDANLNSPMAAALSIGSSRAPTGVTANLSWKKVTLPQLTKKLVIKLNKGERSLPTARLEEISYVLQELGSLIIHSDTAFVLPLCLYLKGSLSEEGNHDKRLHLFVLFSTFYELVISRNGRTCNGWQALRCTMCRGSGKVHYQVKNYSLKSREKATTECVTDAIADNRVDLVHLPSTMDLQVPLPSKDCPSCDGSGVMKCLECKGKL